jgi:hypothetical protein
MAPDACPRCGQSHIVKILWGYSTLAEEHSKAIVSGQTILGLNRRYFRKDDPREVVSGARVHRLEKSRLPAWGCLVCNPEWKDLHRLAALELEFEEAKWTASQAGDFEKAAGLLHAQMRLELEHSQEIWTILSLLARDAAIED